MSRRRTTTEERLLLTRAFPKYDAMAPNSDDREKLIDELLQVLAVGSSIWTPPSHIEECR
jgi:hypothetical protein